MPTGALTGYIDVAQLTLYAFWIFFAGLIFYLHRENKREGYPLITDAADRRRNVTVVGFPNLPKPKTFVTHTGKTYQAPPGNPETREVALKPAAAFPGAPLEPTGDPMLDGVGPAAWAERADEPEMTWDNLPLIAPMRVASDTHVVEEDPDPRGMPVIAGDGLVAGTVKDLWIDRAEPQIRYLEVEVADGGRHVLLPINYCRISRMKRTVRCGAIFAKHFAQVPALKNPDIVTKLEEDKITGFFAGGLFYASPERSEPIL